MCIYIYIIYNSIQYIGLACAYFSSGPTLAWDATKILQRLESTSPCAVTEGILMDKIVLVVKIPLRMQITTGEDTVTEEKQRENLNLVRGLI
jgi:hypothetical protein